MGLRIPHNRVDELSREFEQFHTIKVENFVHGDLLRKITASIATAKFSPRTDKGIAHELCMEESLPLHALWVSLNDTALFEFIHRVTGAEPIRCFRGRMYKLLPGGEYFDSWHDDAADGHRMVGMSINFSPEPYEGGVFEIKQLDPERYIRAMPNLGLGDAIFFRIGPQLKHRVSAMAGNRAKTAFAGWFQDSPNFIDLLRELSQETGHN